MTGAITRRRLLVPAMSVLLIGGVATAASSAQDKHRERRDGSPVMGEDPANQPAPQSLARVSKRDKPSEVDDDGINTGRTKPARQLRGDKRQVKPTDVLLESSARGGCAKGYGTGAVCLPAVPPSAAKHAGHGMTITWTCDEARNVLPSGIKINGKDRLGLDSNGDGTACGPGDD